MLDFFKREINVGDFVAGTSRDTSSFSIYRVIGFTAKMVKLKYLNTTGNYKHNKNPESLIIIPEETLVYYNLVK
jgi:hypothetical protein